MLMSPPFKINVWAESLLIIYKYPSIFPTAANNTEKTFYSTKLHNNAR